MNILSIGAGYVGGPTMAVMAAQCPQHQFMVVDIDEHRIAAWNTPGQLPIYEPKLDEIVEEHRGVNLFFSTAVEAAIATADIIFISVDTPTKRTGEGAGRACDTSRVEAVARTIRDNVTHDTIVVEKTTVPVRTAATLNDIFADCPHVITVLSNPEFLAEGTAIDDLTYPDRVLIGHEQGAHGVDAARILADLYADWVPLGDIILTNTYSSELTKLVANAFLAQRVSSINSIAEVCEQTGADVREVAQAIGADRRIGSNFLKASLGFGGSCFRKDVLSLVYIAESLGLHEVAEYWQQVVTMNEHQQDRLARRTLREMYGSLAGKKIAVFGYAFKANTGDTRDTPVARLCYNLIREGANICITDPKAVQSLRQQSYAQSQILRVGADLEPHAPKASGAIRFIHDDPFTTANGADAVIIATEWGQYRTLNWQTIYNRMDEPAYLFDWRNILNHREMRKIGFRLQHIGG
ncbi:MAG: nucleotide sugar dehydrogenase [Planctomycetota bacterium]|jgi:UDPglucose 6-dehydrogenase